MSSRSHTLTTKCLQPIAVWNFRCNDAPLGSIKQSTRTHKRVAFGEKAIEKKKRKSDWNNNDDKRDTVETKNEEQDKEVRVFNNKHI